MPENSIFQKTEQVLLDLLANNLFGAGKSVSVISSDWRSVWYESYLQAVSLTAFANLPAEISESADFSVIRVKLKQGISDNLIVNSGHLKIHNLLTKAGVPYVFLKGLASAIYYPDPLLRSMGDVDFLVGEKDLANTCEILKENGFTPSDKSHGDHLVFTDGACRYEVHTEPAGMPEGEIGAKVQDFLKDILTNDRNVRTLFGEIVVPSSFHHGLILILHTCHHLTSSGVGLRHLCDWAVFVNSFSDDEFCALFETKFKEIGLWKFACILTKFCEKYLSCPPQKWVGEVDNALVDGLAEDVFKGGNLGQKDDDRSHEAMILAKYGDQEHKGKSKRGRFVEYVNKSVKNNWKSAEQFKVLLPVGWVFFGGRYIIRSIRGKRPKIRVKSFLYDADQRTELFNQFNLFEKET